MNPISVIIPAYNEAAAIGRVISDIKQILGAGTYEIIVVNDGSNDGTEKVAADAGARVLSNPINMGYGFSLKRGFQTALHECVVITDADGTYPIDKIPEMVEYFSRGFDMVVGARTGSAYYSSWAKGLARFIFKWMSEYVVGKKIPDINSGFRVIRRSLILPLLPDLSNTFSFSTSSTLLFMLKKYFVGYIPIQYHKRTGKSKVKYVRDALIATQIMVEIIARYNPIKLFLLVAAIPGTLSMLAILALFIHPAPVIFMFGMINFYVALLCLSLGFLAVAHRER